MRRSPLGVVLGITVLLLAAWAAVTWAGQEADEDANDPIMRSRWATALWMVVCVALVVMTAVSAWATRRVAPPPPAPPAPPPVRPGDELAALAAGLAHELGQPLSAARVDIEGLHLLRQLGREPSPEHADRVLSRVGTCILAMGQTIEHLRALALDPAAEASRQVLDLRDLVDAVLAERDRWLRFTETRIAWDRPPQPLLATADPAGLRLILVNLLRNAAEAVAVQDPVRRLVRITAGPGPQFTVLDSGPGIPAEEIDHVFDPFRSSKGPGRGVGLALVRASAQRMGATLEVASEAGLGAAFTVRLEAPP